jgi:predicted metal-dependent phosphoesterase TrpH
LHVHTNASDGVSDVRSVLAAARDQDLDVLAITDHNNTASAFEAQRLAPAFGIEVVIGEEVTTSQGHCLGYFLQQRVPRGRPLAETIATIHAQGGLATIPHPCDYVSFGVLNPWRRKLTLEALMEHDFDGLEVYNASLIADRANGRAYDLAEGSGRAIVAGSDAHTAATVGLGVTLFPGRTAEDLRQAIVSRSTLPSGRGWSTRQYLALLTQRELRYAGVAASYAVGLCSAAALAAALALRSGIARLL